MSGGVVGTGGAGVADMKKTFEEIAVYVAEEYAAWRLRDWMQSMNLREKYFDQDTVVERYEYFYKTRLQQLFEIPEAP
jgi:hypothetical protein